MIINGIVFAIGVVIFAFTAFCFYWMGRNDERDIWERESRRNAKWGN